MMSDRTNRVPEPYDMIFFFMCNELWLKLDREISSIRWFTHLLKYFVRFNTEDEVNLDSFNSIKLPNNLPPSSG